MTIQIGNGARGAWTEWLSSKAAADFIGHLTNQARELQEAWAVGQFDKWEVSQAAQIKANVYLELLGELEEVRDTLIIERK